MPQSTVPLEVSGVRKAELRKRLVDDNVPANSYYLDGFYSPGERLCLEETAGGWQVFYSERGIKTGVWKFATEDAACDYFYQAVRDMNKH